MAREIRARIQKENEIASHWLNIRVPLESTPDQKQSFFEWLVGESRLYKKGRPHDRLCQPSYTTPEQHQQPMALNNEQSDSSQGAK